MTNTKTFLSQPLLRLVIKCLLPLGLFPLLEYLAIAPYGSAFFLQLELVIIMPLLAALFVFVIAPFQLFVRRLRPLAARALISAVVFTAASIGGLLLGMPIRREAFYSLAERSTPLVQAIRSYEARHGTPPARLDALVPDFLPTIPKTGMGAYPSFKYHVGEKAAQFQGNPWVLEVFTPSGGINFDTFLYFPLQNYPRKGYGGSLERISNWAYVHE